MPPGLMKLRHQRAEHQRPFLTPLLQHPTPRLLPRRRHQPGERGLDKIVSTMQDVAALQLLYPAQKTAPHQRRQLRVEAKQHQQQEAQRELGQDKIDSKTCDAIARHPALLPRLKLVLRLRLLLLQTPMQHRDQLHVAERDRALIATRCGNA
jgi:hypothetical protein